MVDLLFYDDVLAVVPKRSGIDPMNPLAFALALLAWFAIEPRLRARRDRREATPATLPRRTRLIPLGDVRTVEVRELHYGAADLVIDGDLYFVSSATRYRPPWREALGPLFGNRLTVVAGTSTDGG
jgi:hypothetical protein